jgi:lysozyme
MNISQNCLDLITEFEGLELKAYIDPVGIPTIGYGTIRYPNGRKVQLGDAISEAEAEAFLKFECDAIGVRMAEAMQNVALSQNQYDALVSFCYNVGFGAFLDSTLLRNLKAGNVAAAASEFLRWNKGTVNGVKQELPGLTRRRTSEKQLFERQAAGGTPLEEVIQVKGFRDGKVNVLVGLSEAGAVLDIVELDDMLPVTMVAALKQYPKLTAFEIAKADERIPAGVRSHLSGLARPMGRTRRAPKLDRDLLLLGMEDDEANPGNDIKEMQGRLKELGYYEGPVDGIFTLPTDVAVKDFQEDFFGPTEADGRVGPLTWKKLWGDGKTKDLEPGTAAAGKNFLRLTKSAERDAAGCFVLDLGYYKDGELAGSIETSSGIASKQNFRTGPNSPSGTMEPLPEGQWRIHDIEWAAGKDNYSGAVWNNGLGPAKIRMDYVGPGRTRRSAIEIHIDWNRPSAPGTAGCVGVRNVADFKTLVTWLRDTDPRALFVDWGLGTCPAP